MHIHLKLNTNVHSCVFERENGWCVLKKRVLEVKMTLIKHHNALHFQFSWSTEPSSLVGRIKVGESELREAFFIVAELKWRKKHLTVLEKKKIYCLHHRISFIYHFHWLVSASLVGCMFCSNKSSARVSVSLRWKTEAMPGVITDLFCGKYLRLAVWCIKKIDLRIFFTVNQWVRQGHKGTKTPLFVLSCHAFNWCRGSLNFYVEDYSGLTLSNRVNAFYDPQLLWLFS